MKNFASLIAEIEEKNYPKTGITISSIETSDPQDILSLLMFRELKAALESDTVSVVLNVQYEKSQTHDKTGADYGYYRILGDGYKMQLKRNTKADKMHFNCSTKYKAEFDTVDLSKFETVKYIPNLKKDGTCKNIKFEVGFDEVVELEKILAAILSKPLVAKEKPNEENPKKTSEKSNTEETTKPNTEKPKTRKPGKKRPAKK